MDLVVEPGALTGALNIMPSKSHAHRALICAALAEGDSRLSLPLRSMDMNVTIDCLRALGSKISCDDEGICHIHPLAKGEKKTTLHCQESGSTLRFLLPVAAALGGEIHFTGSGRLPERPIDALLEALAAGGCRYSRHSLPLTISGRFRGGKVALPGDISSQYISGLLLAAPLTGQGLDIQLTTTLESAAYVDITCHTMAAFGVDVKAENNFSVAPNSTYHAAKELYHIPGDWSNAAFFLVAGALSQGNDAIKLTGLDLSDPQGDRAIIEILRAYGAGVDCWPDHIVIRPAPLRGMAVDVSDIPDLLPILSVLAAAADGDSHFYNAKRLRLKESDRLESTAAMLKALGVPIQLTEDSLTVSGGHSLHAGEINSAGDHRIAMSAAILAASLATEKVIIRGAEAVNKSYPHFFSDFKTLGGSYREL